MAARKKKGGKKKAGKKKGGKKKGGGEMYLVASKVRDAVRASGCNMGGDAAEGLNGWVGFLISQATARAHANGRKTVRAHDFIVD